MGIDYFLIDKKNKTLFELGRGNWHNLGKNLTCIKDVGRLQECLLGKVFSYYGDVRGEFHFHVSEYLVNEIHSCFGKTPAEQLAVISDCSTAYSEIQKEDYTCVGTRYEIRGTPAWEEAVASCMKKPILL